MTNQISVKELWDDPTGQYCSEISIDGTRAATCYSRIVETALLGAITDRHCVVKRDASRVLRQQRRRLRER